VQDPEVASYPDMPESVITNVGAHYCVPVAQMGALLSELVSRELQESKQIPKDIAIEAKIARRVLSDLPSVEALGDQVPL
jgi:two-component system, chemotaxis family, protein-glutamate methylesterase/glutaminase